MNLETLTVRLVGDTTDFVAKMASAGQAVQAVGDKMQATGQRMQSMGYQWSAFVSAPLIAMGKDALGAAADFETTMNVMEQVTRANADQMKALSDQALDLGMKTIFSAGQAAEAQLELSKAGMEVNDVMGAMPGVLDLAAAGDVDLASAAKLTAGVLNAFSLEAKESTYVANLLAAAANASSANIGDLSLGMAQGGFAFAAANQKVDDLAAALGILTNVGLKGTDAGTALKNMMQQLYGPTDKAREAMAHYNLNIFDANGNMKPLVEIIDIFNKQLGGLSQEQRLAVLDTILLSDGMKAMIPLMTAGAEGFTAMKDAVNEEGAAADVANARMKGLAGAIEYFRGTIETLMIQTATPWLEQLSSMIRWIADLIAKFGELDPALQKNIVIFAALLAVIGPILIYSGLLVSSVGSLVSVFGALLSPMGLVAVALGAVVAAALMGNDTFNTLTKYIRAVLKDGDYLNDWLTHLPEPMRGVVRIAGMFVATLQNIGKYIWAILVDGDYLNDWLTHLPEPIQNVARAFGEMLAYVRNNFGNWVKVAWGWIVDATPIALAKLGEWGAALWNWVTQNWPVWKQYLLTWATAAWNWIAEMTPIALAKLGEWGTMLWNWLIENWPTWKAKLGEWANAAWQWILDMIPVAIEKLGEWGTALWNWLTENLPTWKVKLLEWGNAAWQWIVDALPTIKEKMGELGTWLYDWLVENKPDLQPWIDAFLDFTKGAKQGFDDTFGPMMDKFKEFSDTVRREIPLLMGAFGRLWSAIFGGNGSDSPEEAGRKTVSQLMNFIGMIATTAGTILTQIRILTDAMAAAAGVVRAFMSADWAAMDAAGGKFNAAIAEFAKVTGDQWKHYVDYLKEAVRIHESSRPSHDTSNIISGGSIGGAASASVSSIAPRSTDNSRSVVVNNQITVGAGANAGAVATAAQNGTLAGLRQVGYA